MFGFSKVIDKFKNAKYSNDIKNEYTKIVQFEEKRKKLMSEYGDEVPDEIAITQRDMLRNNLISLAHVAKDKNVLQYTAKDVENGFYFNIQGTSPRVLVTEKSLSSAEITDKTGNFPSLMTRIDTGIFAEITQDMIKLENAFIDIKSKKVKRTVKNKLASLAEKKIIKKIYAFCDAFKGNEQLFKDYIFSGISGLNEDDHWHNYELMKHRLNFIGLLYYAVELSDSESFEIAPKELIYVYNDTSNIEVGTFLSKINTNKYDFIITDHRKQRGGIIND